MIKFIENVLLLVAACVFVVAFAFAATVGSQMRQGNSYEQAVVVTSAQVINNIKSITL